MTDITHAITIALNATPLYWYGHEAEGSQAAGPSKAALFVCLKNLVGVS
jgi:hypothetical protein